DKLAVACGEQVRWSYAEFDALCDRVAAGLAERGVAVIGVPHPRWVEAVVAIVVAKPDATLDEAAVLAHCAAQLATFKQPKRVVFVAALPKNPSGKLLKRELRLQHQGLFA
ncbi:MAG TPA: hypothetical protein VFQ20_03575, partial [Burkholderiaceae bacterium]|nr:hypothetical protein [Burkholderiaceae bacterium]